MAFRANMASRGHKSTVQYVGHIGWTSTHTRKCLSKTNKHGGHTDRHNLTPREEIFCMYLQRRDVLTWKFRMWPAGHAVEQMDTGWVWFSRCPLVHLSLSTFSCRLEETPGLKLDAYDDAPIRWNIILRVSSIGNLSKALSCSNARITRGLRVGLMGSWNTGIWRGNRCKVLVETPEFKKHLSWSFI